MLLELPVTEALALATAEQPLPPVVRSVRVVGSALHVEVDLGQVPGASTRILWAAAALGTVTVRATFLRWDRGAATFAVAVQARGLPAHVLLNQLLGPVREALARQGLPPGLVELRRGDPEPLAVVHVQEAVSARAPGLVITGLHLRDGTLRAAATVRGVEPQR